MIRDMEPIIISDPSKCTELSKMMRKEINRGGYGFITELSNGMLVKQQLEAQIGVEKDCLEGRGCTNDLLLEGLIMHVLNALGSPHFVRLEALYKCDNKYLLVMKKLDGIDYTTYLKQNKVSNLDRLTILFQITYALYLANSQFTFVHGDLIGRNIIICHVPEAIETYKVNNKMIRASNRGIRVVLLDFGFSRIKYKGVDIFREQKDPSMFPTTDDLFNGTADICKIYGNPNFKVDAINRVTVNGRKLSDIIKECRAIGWSYIAVPPFPSITAEDILKSDLFKEIVITSTDYSNAVKNAIEDVKTILNT
jgi:hypothetical protein